MTSTAICIDCDWHHHHTVSMPGLTCKPDGAPGHDGLPRPDFVCEHFRPEYWEQRGYVRHWGDAAVSNYPKLEILRKEDPGKGVNPRVSYVILAPFVTRRPVQLWAYADFDARRLESWGGY